MNQTRRLYLLRHAKSSWKDASLRDDERPLAPRGKRATALLQQHFRAIGLSVDLVLCSPARRTRQTWDGVRAGRRFDPDVTIVAAVYAATAGELVDLVHGVGESVGSVLIVGHNPGIEQLAAGLVGDGQTNAVARLRDGFPTGAFATLSVGSAWAEVAWGGAYLDDYVRPRDLSGR